LDRLDKVINRLKTFRDERNWQQYHTPENLSKSIVLEASELLENFQYSELNKEDVHNVKEELADIFAYGLLLMEHYDFDFEAMMHEKITKNAKKYPK